MLTPGKVYLVGAGPGDPGLITRRGLNILRNADVVMHDRLVSDDLLLEVRADAELIDVGKSAAGHSTEQADINHLLAEYALAGYSVCRLKGGDPFLFGRGGEEADYLVEKNISFEIIPGVSSALAAPAFAGIPITDRRLASSVAIVTGRPTDGSRREPDWEALGRAADTIVVLMGMARLAEITHALLRSGLPSSLPAAVICWASTGRQQTLISDLTHIAENAQRQELGPPGVLVVGEVAALANRLSWFGGPLMGRRVIVTRPRRQAGSLAASLRTLGAEPLICPLLKIEHLSVAPERLQGILSEHWDWALFTSANAVEHFYRQLYDAKLDWRALAGVNLAAVGAPTATALERFGLIVSFLPARFLTERLAEELPDIAAGSRVLALRAREADGGLVNALTLRGAYVLHHPTHYIAPEPAGAAVLQNIISNQEADAISFTSPSAVKAALAAVGSTALASLEVISIGPATTRAAHKHNLSVSCEAKRHTAKGLAEAFADHCLHDFQATLSSPTKDCECEPV